MNLIFILPDLAKCCQITMCRPLLCSLIMGALAAISIISLIISSNSHYTAGERYEFILGYEFEQAYSVPWDKCRRDSEAVKNTTFGCSTLYRLPIAISDAYCRQTDPHYYPDVVCPVRFLRQTRVYIVTGLMQYPDGGEWEYPGREHNTTNPNEWFFAHRQGNEMFDVIPSSTKCYDKNVVETNQCINDFLRERRKMRIVYCWGSLFCSVSEDGQPLWFNGDTPLVLSVLSTLAFSLFFLVSFGGFCFEMWHKCRQRSLPAINVTLDENSDHENVKVDFDRFNAGLEPAPVAYAGRQERSLDRVLGGGVNAIPLADNVRTPLVSSV